MYLPALPAIARELGVPIARGAGQPGQLLHRHRARSGPLRSAVRSTGAQAGALCRARRSSSARRSAAPSRPTSRSSIVFRFLQALGGCAPLVVPRAVVRDYFDGRESVRMLSVLMLVMGLAPIRGAARRRAAPGAFRMAIGLPACWPAMGSPGSGWWRGCCPKACRPELRRRQSVTAIAGDLPGACCAIATISAGCVSGGLDLRGAAGLHLRVVVRVHRAVPRAAGALRALLRRQRHRPDRSRRRSTGSSPSACDAEVIVRTVLPIAVIAGVTLLVDAYTGFGGFAGHPRAALLLHRLPRLRGPEHHGAGHEPVRQRWRASASALMGTLQFVLGAAAGGLVSAFGNGTAVPFAAVVAGCGITAFAVHRTLPVRAAALTPAGRRRRARQPARRVARRRHPTSVG